MRLQIHARRAVGPLLLLVLWVVLALAPGVAQATGSGPPVNTVLPTITGTAKDGQTLKAVKGTWTGSATITYTYQWQLCESSGQGCSNIAAATKTSYKLGHETVGHTLRLVVTTTNTLGKASATSAATAVVAPAPPVETKLPAITGTAKVGSPLTATTGTWTGTTPLAYSYQWQGCNSSGEACTNISGATGAGYIPGPAEVGTKVRVIVTATNAAGHAAATSLASKAIAPGTGVARINLCGTISKSETLSPAAAYVYVLTCPVTVPAKVTLTLAPGTIIKAEPGTALNVHGTLTAKGEPGSPVTFTSINDNSIGGTTGLQPPESGNWAGLSGGGGSSLVLQGVVVRYAAAGVRSEAGSVSIAGGVFSEEGNGVEAIYATAFSLTGSSVSAQEAPVSVRYPQGATTVTGDTVTATKRPEGISVEQAQATPAVGMKPVFVAHNTVATTDVLEETSVVSAALTVDSPDVNFAELETNTVSVSGGPARVSVGGTIAKSQTWSPQSFGWAIERGPLNVASGETLTMTAGLTVKSDVGGCDEVFGTCGEGGTGNIWASIGVQGSLVAEGTSASPVTITSTNDNSIGGTTSLTTPKAGDWQGIYAGSNAHVALEHTTLRYASTALSVAEGAEATVHGAILNSTVGVSAADYVDASKVAWGSPSGPSPIGTGTVIQGSGVQPGLWIGETAPARGGTITVPPPPPRPCAEILFLGARGSGEPPQGGEAYLDQVTDMGDKVRESYEGFKRQLEIDATAKGVPTPTMEAVAIQYPALSVNTIWSFSAFSYTQNLWEGVASVEQTLAKEETRCQKAKFVLAGYSSGAFAVHGALTELAGSASTSTSKIAAVVFVADPAKNVNEGDFHVGTAPASAEGIWTLLYGGTIDEVGPVPTSLLPRTITLCNTKDIVCAPSAIILPSGFAYSSTWQVHGAYHGQELFELGDWAAEEEFARR